MRPSFFDLTLEDLRALLLSQGLNRFGAAQMFDWVYRKGVRDPAGWSNVAKETRAWFAENYDFLLPRVVWHGLS
jgi:23S rRNA (adenine2503-C2)-methyltransferase